jgi:hypothetical protein
MATINTRRNISGLGLVSNVQNPRPSGQISRGDVKQVADIYRGLPVSGAGTVGSQKLITLVAMINVLLGSRVSMKGAIVARPSITVNSTCLNNRIRSLSCYNTLLINSVFAANRISQLSAQNSITIQSSANIRRIKQILSAYTININSSTGLSIKGVLRAFGQLVINSVVSVTKAIVGGGGGFRAGNINLRRNISSLGQESNIQYPHPISVATSPSDRRHIADIYRANLVGVSSVGPVQKIITLVSSLVINSVAAYNRLRRLNSNSVVNVNSANTYNRSKQLNSNISLLINSVNNYNRIRQISQVSNLSILNNSQLRRIGYCASQSQLNIINSCRVATKATIRSVSQITVSSVFSLTTTTQKLINFVATIAVLSGTNLNRTRQLSQNSSLAIISRESIRRLGLVGSIGVLTVNSFVTTRRIGSIGIRSLVSIISGVRINGGQLPTVIISIYPFSLRINRMAEFVLSTQRTKLFNFSIERADHTNLHITKE